MWSLIGFRLTLVNTGKSNTEFLANPGLLKFSTTFHVTHQPILRYIWNGKISHELSFFERSTLSQIIKIIIITKKFVHNCSLFLSGSDSSRKTHKVIPENKLSKLLKEFQPRQNAEKVIFNYSNISFSDSEKYLLVNGLQFSISPRKV